MLPILIPLVASAALRHAQLDCSCHAAGLATLECSQSLSSCLRSSETYDACHQAKAGCDGLPVMRGNSSSLATVATARASLPLMPADVVHIAQYALVGSANINERSMSGTRDTEICVGAHQPNLERRNRGQVGFATTQPDCISSACLPKVLHPEWIDLRSKHVCRCTVSGCRSWTNTWAALLTRATRCSTSRDRGNACNVYGKWLRCEGSPAQRLT